MNNLAPVMAVLLLWGCASPAADLSASAKSRFESAIARALLKEVRETLPRLEGIERAAWLKQKLRQFNNSVDLNLIGSGLRLEHRLLDHLAVAEELKHAGGDWRERLASLTSLDWSLQTYEHKTLQEAGRIDRAIAAQAAGDDRLAPAALMARVRSRAIYPHDSFAGRQAYLDRLSEAMLHAQADWHSLLTRYEPSSLAILGEEGAGRTFLYSDDGLIINLDQVTDLPRFEIKCIAVYYGYPGLQSLAGRHPESLRSLIEIPAYTLGWAGYILDVTTAKETPATPHCLYFSRLLTGLALADLRINTGEWSRREASDYIFASAPYSRHRIDLMLNQVRENPGQYLAALAGKLRFRELHGLCLRRDDACEARFNQQIADLGPVPFEVLEARLTGQ